MAWLGLAWLGLAWLTLRSTLTHSLTHETRNHALLAAHAVIFKPMVSFLELVDVELAKAGVVLDMFSGFAGFLRRYTHGAGGWSGGGSDAGGGGGGRDINDAINVEMKTPWSGLDVLHTVRLFSFFFFLFSFFFFLFSFFFFLFSFFFFLFSFFVSALTSLPSTHGELHVGRDARDALCQPPLQRAHEHRGKGRRGGGGGGGGGGRGRRGNVTAPHRLQHYWEEAKRAARARARHLVVLVCKARPERRPRRIHRRHTLLHYPCPCPRLCFPSTRRRRRGELDHGGAEGGDEARECDGVGHHVFVDARGGAVREGGVVVGEGVGE